MRRGKFIMTIFLVGIMILSVLGSIMSLEVKGESVAKGASNGLVSHAPIYIDGNDNFTSENGMVNGSGIEGDPYIIENWEIDVSTANGIEIRNTDVHFIIRNCAIHDGRSNCKAGVYLKSVKNGKIENVTSYNNYWGICLESSSNNTIINCAVYNNPNSIYLSYSSNNNQITNCAVYNNSGGISLWSSSNNILRTNILENNKYNFGVYGVKISHFYQDIDTSNTINGKSIYYIIEQNGLFFDSTMNMGYLGLVSCSNIKVENLTFTDNGNGLLLANTTYSTLTNCDVYNNYVGIYLHCSSNNNQISNCSVYNNSDYGIELYSSSNNNQISNCSVYNNSYGIYLDYSSNNEIHYNDICNNTNYGISNWNTKSEYQANATYNWWGSANGPGGVGPGNGDSVSSNVLYEPWLTEPAVEISWTLPEGEEVAPEKEGAPAEGFNIIYLAVIGGGVAASIIIIVLLLRKREIAIPKNEIPAPKPDLIAPQIPTFTLRCPQCKTTFQVESKERPFKVKCPSCGTEGMIK